MKPLNSNGTSLILNLVVMAAFALMAVVVYASAKSMVGEVTYNQRSAQALAIAEAGLEDALHSLYQNSTWRTGFVNKSFAGGTYTVTLTTDTPPTITSTGYAAAILLKGRAARTVTVVATFTTGMCPYALLADKAMQIDGSVNAYDANVSLTPSTFTVGANVRSNSGVSVGGASCPPPHIFGDVTSVGSVPPGSCATGTVATTTVTLPIDSNENCAAFASDSANSNGTGVSPSGAYNSGSQKLTVNSGQTVTLSSGTYYFKQVNIDGTLNVNTSSGAVTICLKNNFTSSSGCQINSTSMIPSRLHIYSVNGGNKITLNCASPLHAYIEGEQSNFTLAQEMYGHFCADRVDISSTTGAVGLLHYDLGGGAVSHVAWTTGSGGSWSESYKRQ